MGDTIAQDACPFLLCWRWLQFCCGGAGCKRWRFTLPCSGMCWRWLQRCRESHTSRKVRIFGTSPEKREKTERAQKKRLPAWKKQGAAHRGSVLALPQVKINTLAHVGGE